jgi:hypothetical protein
MPISKKPRSKTAFRTSTKAHAPAALPDRRAMESFLAAIAGHRGDDATAKAQDLMYEAWERTTSRSRIALARKALGISPLCADAYVLLAEEIWRLPPRSGRSDQPFSIARCGACRIRRQALLLARARR